MGKYPTAHIDATPEEIARVVLMPGDPLRSRFIADTYLTDAQLFNNVRGVQGYTGFYKGERISVMASGMGIPSIGIYSYELFNFFDVDAILRVGSAGAYPDEVRIKDIVLGMGACTTSAYAEQFSLEGTVAPLADYRLLALAAEICREREARYHVGNLLSDDVFYHEDIAFHEKWKRMGVLATEMEAAALYLNAARAGKRALAICSVSDHLFRHESISPSDRQEGLGNMLEVALETAVRYLQGDRKP